MTEKGGDGKRGKDGTGKMGKVGAQGAESRLLVITFKRIRPTIAAQHKRASLWGFHRSGIFLCIFKQI
jgi:hypothetical protein